MKSNLLGKLSLVAMVGLASWSGIAQQSATVPAAVVASSAVPKLMNYSGVVTDANRQPLSSITGVTFLLYKEQQGGAPLWMETQNVVPDRTGHYTVTLGATKSEGLPADVFANGEARWLGVQVTGQAEQARVLLVAVPYAMKAKDADTIGGLPPSAFVLAVPVGVSSGVASAGASNSATGAAVAPPPASSNVTTTGGTVNTIPLFSTATNIQNSAITQTGTGATAKVGIGTVAPASKLDVGGAATVRGALSLPATGAATAVAGKNSQPEDFVASSFSSSTSAALNQTFQWQAEPAANNTANPSGTLNLLYGLGASAPAETGLKVSKGGVFTFAAGQTFPGTGTISGITTAAGSGLAGGGTTGTLGLKLLSTCAANQILKWSGTAWACAADANAGGTVKSVASGAGLTGGPITSTGTLSIANAGVTNTMLQHPSLTVTAGSDLTGGGAVALGGATTLSLDTTKVPLLASANTFTNNQTVNGTLTATTLMGTNAILSGQLLVNSSGSDAVFAESGSPSATTIFGQALSATGDAWGVEGLTESSASNAFGVFGNAGAASGEPVGVYGTAASTTGIGVFGSNGGESGTGVGFYTVTGTVGVGTWGDGGTTFGNKGIVGTVDDGNAGFFLNNAVDGFYTVYIQAENSVTFPFLAYNSANNTSCYVDNTGNLNCTGTKNAVVPIDRGKRKVAMSAIESPVNWFEDAGSGQLVNGAAVVRLDADFIQTVNTDMEYHIFLTPGGNCKGLYFANKTATSFEVRELGDGTSSVNFDYRIMALRKKYETVRFADHSNDPDPRKQMLGRATKQGVQPHPQSHDPHKSGVLPTRTAMQAQPHPAVAR